MAGEAAAAGDLDAPWAAREVSKAGVRGGGGRRLRQERAVLEPRAREEREEPTQRPDLGSLRGCRAGSRGDGARGAAAAAPRALRGETAPRSRPWRGERRGWSAVPGRRRRALHPGPGRGVSGVPSALWPSGEEPGFGRWADAAGARLAGSRLRVRC